jgi:hypothetical protein
MMAMQQYLDYRKREGETITDDSPLFTKKNKLGERMTRSLISWQLTKLGTSPKDNALPSPAKFFFRDPRILRGLPLT